MKPDKAADSSFVVRPCDPPADYGGLVELVLAANNGDPMAWKALVGRFTPLVQSVIRQYRLSFSDAQDVSQMVWLRLFKNLTKIRDQSRLPGWIRTTTRNEALRMLGSRPRADPVDPSVLVRLEVPDHDQGPDDALLRSERDKAIVDGLAELTPVDRNLLILLHAEPMASYQEISQALGMPLGSIGPTRARSLKKLSRTAAVRTFLWSECDPVTAA